MNPGLERPSREPIQVGDLMSRIVHTTTEMETVREAHATMRMSRIRHLPVLDARGDLIGVVSDRRHTRLGGDDAQLAMGPPHDACTSGRGAHVAR